ncbi:hypothetical protein FisN_14Hh279 [Fistulifera solaris]|uniref:Bicarbonate transporter-like transmembrane domain-containing protein n=1 Tax=Fistulifera solaris TaxID=1519565 RepID=A0A1Z5KB94_FISSO|nr:hypothetical protein FisN_14Hh279 [Fistulifera solaris]|eukprot:GAX23544.1 hypothetical protein FisN_14Hh279 [Fistulifera solaris]
MNQGNTPTIAAEEERGQQPVLGGPDEEPRLFVPFKGMKEDLSGRLPFYADDWGAPKSFFTVFNSAIYTFVIQLVPALIFAELMTTETEGNLAVVEVLLSKGILGVIYAVFSGQPIVITGVTAPVAILLGASYQLIEQYNADYFAFFFWTCFWAGTLHMISALVGLVSLVWHITPFTTQVFELFIGLTFVYTSIKELVEPISFTNGELQDDRSQQYATLLIGFITMWVAWTLHSAETWPFFTRGVRVFLTSYNTVIAVVMGTAFSYLPGVDLSDDDQIGIYRVNVTAPWDWQPTADRKWVVNPLKGIDGRGIAAAFVPGLMLFLLFIIDHNVSSIMTQQTKFNLQKPPTFHWDFFVLGLTFIPCAILGIPPGSGLIPTSPLHARALCTRRYLVDDHGVEREVVIHCEEQRWSGLGQALLMFVSLVSLKVVSWIPKGCLFGLFLYMGMCAFHGNEVWERIILAIIQPSKRPATALVRNVAWGRVMMYTAIQFSLAFAVFATAQFASIGYIYPALLIVLVPIRSYVVSRIFSADDLKFLDPSSQSAEEFAEAQALLGKALRMETDSDTSEESSN